MKRNSFFHATQGPSSTKIPMSKLKFSKIPVFSVYLMNSRKIFNNLYYVSDNDGTYMILNSNCT